MPIPCPHFKITIIKRSQGQSAVAGAAYQSGERLFSEYDQKTKFYNKKKELVHAEIMLPSHAPPGYADRATLWHAVEAVENQWNSQLARRIVLALPREVPKGQYTGNNRLFRLECRARTRRGGLLRFPRRVGFLNRGLLDWRSLFRRSVTGTIRARGLRAGFEFVICHSLTSFNFGVLHKNER